MCSTVCHILWRVINALAFIFGVLKQKRVILTEREGSMMRSMFWIWETLVSSTVLKNECTVINFMHYHVSKPSALR